MFKARDYLNNKCLLNLYHTYIFPYLIYGIEAWGNASHCHILPLFLTQKIIIRLITFSKHLAHTEPILKSLNISSTNKHRFTVFSACRPCGPAGWLALLLTKAGDVETNPGPTTLNKKIWICDICHKQIHVRKQISIRSNRIEHWVHLRCAGIRQVHYTDTWTCHLHR